MMRVGWVPFLAAVPLLLGALVSAGAAPPASGLIYSWSAECGGRAPTVTACELGEHSSVSERLELRYGATLRATVALVITFEPSAVAAKEPYVFCAHVDNVGNEFELCPYSGGYPQVGDRYRARCFSYEYRTTNPGGAGDWGCAVYDVVNV